MHSLSRPSRRHLLKFTSAALCSFPARSVAAQGSLLTPYKCGQLVLSASHVKGEYDSIAVDCPFVFHHEGRFYMIFVGFDGVGYQTGLASSDDLIAWRKEGAILRRDPSNPRLRFNIAMNWILRENELSSQGKLVPVNGEFIGAYHAYPNQGYEQGAAVIGLCRSRDLRNWRVDEPVLKPEEGEEWERGGLYKSCLLKSGGTFHLFYNAKNRTDRSWNEQTGVAQSQDLRSWTRYKGNPVLRNGPPGSFDERFASDPCLLQNGKQWAFFYFGLDAKGVARDLVASGPDLFHPVKHQQPLIDVGPPGSVDSVYAHKPSLVTYNGDLYHFYCAVSRGPGGKEIRGISVARSRPWK